MNFKEFQDLASRTANNHLTTDAAYSNWCMGLAGEVGELVELYKKHLYHGKSLDKDKVVKEAGDVLWYLSNLLRTTGIDFSEVPDKNVQKLMERYPDGFQYGGGIRPTKTNNDHENDGN